jgi:hypothetical protein
LGKSVQLAAQNARYGTVPMTRPAIGRAAQIGG